MASFYIHAAKHMIKQKTSLLLWRGLLSLPSGKLCACTCKVIQLAAFTKLLGTILSWTIFDGFGVLWPSDGAKINYYYTNTDRTFSCASPMSNKKNVVIILGAFFPPFWRHILHLDMQKKRVFLFITENWEPRPENPPPERSCALFVWREYHLRDIMTSTRSEPLRAPIVTCVHVALHRAKGYFPWFLLVFLAPFLGGKVTICKKRHGQ